MFNNKTLTELDVKILKEKYPDTYEEQIKKVEQGYPIQYLIGNVPFLNTIININESVLIPRFETEYLVEKILKKVDKYKNNNLKCLDVCTGSGCIAIAIAKNTKFNCFGVDISMDALKIAKENASKNKTLVTFAQLDVLTENLKNEYDIIISNPPYIKENDDIDNQFEPKIALFAANNGLIFYKKILNQIKNKPKLIAFEIGEEQGESISKLAYQKFPTANISIEKDLCGKNRFIFIEQ